MADLSFDVTADSSAASTFLRDAAAARELARELDRLDGRQVRIRVRLDEASRQPIQNLTRQLDEIDRRTARARVEVAGTEQAEARSSAVAAALKALPDRVRSRIEVELDRSAVDRVTQIARGITELTSVTRQATTVLQTFRTATGYLFDPSTLPLISDVSSAIRTRWNAAVESARVGVDRLATGLRGLQVAMLALSAAGQVSTAIAGLGSAIADMTGIALLAPAAISAVGAAYTVAKLATTGFSEALTGSAKASAEALAKMGPEARKLVATLQQLGPAANAFRKAVQEAAVDGLAEQVQRLSSSAMPILQKGLVGVAQGLNTVAVNAARAVQSSSALDNIRTVVDATAQATKGLRDSAANVVVGFINLAAAGSTSLPALGAAIDAAATRFRAWTMAIVSSGQFDAWVARAKRGFADLGTFLGNVGSIGATVLRALDQHGAGLLSTLAAATTQMRNFLQSAQGTQVLSSLAQVAVAAGQALSQVLGTALRVLSPVLVALTPVVIAFAEAFSAHLVHVINLVAPALQRLADELAKHPELIGQLLVKLHTAVTFFGPFVAAVGLAAAALQRMIIARVAAAALSALGLAGTSLGTALMFLVSPLSALRSLFPALAAAVGRWAASLTILAGPVGWLIVAFATLYASSAQFRDAMNQIGAVFGQFFLKALQDAASTIAATVDMIVDLGSAIGSALSGIGGAATATMSIFGPFGDAVSTFFGTIFEWLGKLPGVALAALAAFVGFSKIVPIFTVASTAVAGFATRMLAFQSSSAIATAAATGLGKAATGLSTVLTNVGKALPLVGVALIALGAIWDEVSAKTDEWAAGLIKGGEAARQAREAIDEYNSQFREGSILGNLFRLTQEDINAEIERQIALMSPLEQARARVALAETAYNDAVRESGPGSEAAAIAAQRLADARAAEADAARAAEQAEKSHAQAVRDTLSAHFEAANASLAYEAATRRLEDAKKAAADAERQHGKSSREYKEASDDVVRSSIEVASAAGRRAEAEAQAAGRADAAAVGAQAQAQALLSLAATASGPARDALLKIAAGMNRTELDAISAANATSGLKTEILTLPDGRQVHVLVDPTQAVTGFAAVKKAADAAPTAHKIRVEAPTALAQEQLRQLGITVTAIPGTKDVEIDVKDEAGRAKLDAFLTTVQTASAAPKIDLDTATATEKASAFKAYVDGLVGVAKADADTAPGTGKAAQMKADIDAITAIMKADADIQPGTASAAALQSHIASLVGIMTADANNAPGTAKGDALRAYINGLIGIMEARANTDPATAEGRAAKAYIDGLRAMLTADANTGPARSALNSLVAEWQGRTIYVNIGGNRVTAGGGVFGFDGGGVAGFAGGGMLRRPSRLRGMVIPGYAPGVDTEPTLMSRGEAVLVPELVQLLGASRILAANAEASGGRPATVVGSIASIMDGLIGQTGPAPVVQARITAAVAPRGTGGTTIVAPPDLGPLKAELSALRAELADAMKDPRVINVHGVADDPVETARRTQLALR